MRALYAIVTREPEWDDEQRTRMEALAEYEDGVCSGCGLHSSIADTDPLFTLEDKVCPVCRAAEVNIRGRAATEQKLEEKADPATPRPSDGRTTLLRLLSPEEAAAMRPVDVSAR